MKKIGTLLLAAVILLGLAGCASTEPDPEREGFSFTYNGVQIMPGADAAPVIAALGGPKSYTEEPSCAFEGVDKTYYYGSFYLSTCPMDGKDCVYSLWFVDDSIATGEGIRIGSSQTEVEAACGAGCFDGNNAYIQNRGNSRLTVILTDGAVSSVRYEWIIE